MKTFFYEDTLEAGCDEAGRGCLAGPVVAGSVIFPQNVEIPVLRDSKKLTANQRRKLVPIIKEKAIAYGVAFVSPGKIDEINILRASFLAMHRAIKKLKKTPELLLIDGNRFVPFENIPHKCIIKGDDKYLNIAAASVLAKEARDDYMRKLHLSYPQFSWDKNKGYPTSQHRKAIQQYGASEYHRRSFNLLGSKQLDLFDK